MLRRLAKAGLARGLRWAGADAWFGSLSGWRHRPLVVGYHRVVEDCDAEAPRSLPGMIISSAMLEAHLDWIGRRYKFVSVDELGQRLERADPFEGPVAAVTFDDGYRDVYQNGLPLLKRKGIPAAVFVVADLVGTSRLLLHDRLYLALARVFAGSHWGPRDLPGLLSRLGLAVPEPSPRDCFGALRWLLGTLPAAQLYGVVDAMEAEVGLDEAAQAPFQAMTWPMLREMMAAGMTIGSHSRTHAGLTSEDIETVREEIIGSRRVLESGLGAPVVHVAYPDGRCNATAVAVAVVAGYRYGYTICSHRDPDFPLLTIPRRMLWQQSCVDQLGRFSEAVLSCHANGVFDVLAPCRQDHAWSEEQLGA